MASEPHSIDNITGTSQLRGKSLTGSTRILSGFSCENFHQNSTNSAFRIRTATNGKVVFHVRLAANETRAEPLLNINITRGLVLTDVEGQFSFSWFEKDI